MFTMIEVRVPDIGEFKNIPVIEILVRPGDVVRAEQPIVTLESDKATLDVPSPIGGRVATLAIQPGSRVSLGTLLMTLEVDATAASSTTEPPPPARSQPSTVAPSAQVSLALPSLATSVITADNVVPLTIPAPVEALKRDHSARIYASPSVRRLGRQLGADLARMTGSGRGGRLLIEDVHKSVRDELESSASQPAAEAAQSANPPPSVDFSKYGEIERVPLSRIRRISGVALARNWAAIPHVTNFDVADVTELEAFRGTLNQELRGDPKLTILPFLIKATASTLKRFSAFNASLDQHEVILKKYVNVGVAVDTTDGLVVPVIRDADKLGIIDIARALSAKSAAAAAGKLKSSDFEGGTFTISSLGGVGGTGFTPIINAPEIAILGVARATLQPRWDGSQFQPRQILPLCLSWDHRALDGVAAARFLVHLAALLQDFRRVLM